MNPITHASPSPSELMTVVPSQRSVRAARDFEASLIASLLESLQKTWTLPGEPGLAGEEDYGYLGTQALASGIANRGGFGIAALIVRELAVHEGKGSGSTEGSTSGSERAKDFTTPADPMR